METKILLPNDFSEVQKGKTIAEIAKYYGVSKSTIQKWRRVLSNSDYNKPSHNAALYAKETANLCLNCKKQTCSGICDKFPL